MLPWGQQCPGGGDKSAFPLERKWLGFAERLDCVTWRTLLHLSEPQLTDGTAEGSIQTVGTDTASHSCVHGSCPSRTQQEHLPTQEHHSLVLICPLPMHGASSTLRPTRLLSYFWENKCLPTVSALVPRQSVSLGNRMGCHDLCHLLEI